MTREKIKKLIQETIQKEKKFIRIKIPEILVEKPEERIHGDYSSNVAMMIAKQAKKNPMETAKAIISNFSQT